MEKDKVIILIPSFNEFKTLKTVCNNLKKLNYNFIVLDDKSTDNTNNWLKLKKFKFIKNRVNLGYEENILNGFRYILKKKKFKFIITFDADMEHKISDLKTAFKIIDKNLDLIIFNRNKFNRWSENLLNFFFERKFNLKDPLSGFKVYKVKKLKRIFKLINNDKFLVDIVYYFKMKNFSIKNIPIKVRPRKVSKIGSSFNVHIKIIKCLKYIF